MRIKRLMDRGVLTKEFGFDLQKSGVYMAKVDVKAKSVNALMKSFKQCPVFINGFVTSGKDNLCLFFAHEDYPSQCFLEHLRKHPEAETVDDSIVITPLKKLVSPISLVGDRLEMAPCGANCTECALWKEKGGDCVGCPATIYYRGRLWRKPSLIKA